MPVEPVHQLTWAEILALLDHAPPAPDNDGDEDE